MAKRTTALNSTTGTKQIIKISNWHPNAIAYSALPPRRKPIIKHKKPDRWRQTSYGTW